MGIQFCRTIKTVGPIFVSANDDRSPFLRGKYYFGWYGECSGIPNQSRSWGFPEGVRFLELRTFFLENRGFDPPTPHVPTYASNQTKKREFFWGGRGVRLVQRGFVRFIGISKGVRLNPSSTPSYAPANYIASITGDVEILRKKTWIPWLAWLCYWKNLLILWGYCHLSYFKHNLLLNIAIF